MSVGIMEATKCGVIVFVMAVFLAPSVIELSAAEKGINGRLCDIHMKHCSRATGNMEIQCNKRELTDNDAKKRINGRLCELPIKEATGMCGSKVPEKRWGYVPSKKKCFEYWYSKCESNQNGFATVKKCLEVCKRDSQCLKNPERPKLPYPFRFSTSWF
uniref:Putative serine proteinase inhibitor n=1 Tax=Rhipicephalus microplus TaxID=6941 RepID=A0A6M2D6T3_RHIMP